MADDMRIYRRFSEAIQIKYEFENKKMPKTSYTKDISQNGFLFRTNENVPIGSILAIKFFIKDIGNFIEAEGKVIRIEEMIPDKLYEVGIELFGLSDHDNNQISQYLAKYSED